MRKRNFRHEVVSRISSQYEADKVSAPSHVIEEHASSVAATASRAAIISSFMMRINDRPVPRMLSSPSESI